MSDDDWHLREPVDEVEHFEWKPDPPTPFDRWRMRGSMAINIRPRVEGEEQEDVYSLEVRREIIRGVIAANREREALFGPRGSDRRPTKEEPE